MSTITTKRQHNDDSSSARPGTTTASWFVLLQTRAQALFATNPAASAVWHTAAEQQALSDILHVLVAKAPEHSADPSYDRALTFLRNLKASYATTPQGLLLRDQLKTITNREARQQLCYIIDCHQAHESSR